jgi:hypothetical protein
MPRSLPCGLLLVGVLTACSPEPPEKERPPEPQAAQVQDAGRAIGATDTTMPQDPVERARAVQDTLDEADQRQREAVGESGG